MNWLYLNKPQFMKRYILLTAIFTICLTVNAKDDFCEILRNRICMRLCQLDDYLTFIADKSNDIGTRQYYKKQALNMFAGHGYDYEDNGIQKDGIRINIHSKKQIRNRSMYLRTYLNGVLNFTYKKVLIQLPSKVSGIQKIDDKHYVCVCHYTHIEQNDSVHTCIDFFGQKKVKCYIEVENIENGVEYTVLLGDIYAIETKSNLKL